MRYILPIFLAAMLGAATAIAQTSQSSTQSITAATVTIREAPQPKTIWFSAEGNNYYITTGCQPNSGIAWYSQRWGGKLLKTSSTNAAGELRLKEDKAFQPAFALSQKERGGNGMVGFTEGAEFTLDAVKAGTAGGIVTITWKGTVAEVQPIVFEVLKAAPGAAYSVAGSYKANAANAEEPFSFTEPQSVAGTQYRIRVRNATAGERYLTRPLLQSSGGIAVAIYPTVVKDALTIDANGTLARYTITATDGKIAAQGILEDGLQTLSLSTLASGNYLVSVTSEGGISTAKIIKE